MAWNPALFSGKTGLRNRRISFLLPGLFLLNARAQFRLISGETSLKVAFRVSNLLNSRYRDYLDRQRYFADALGRNASLSLGLEF
ncbi:MAG: hypothetical protein R3B47_13865 [Bacteroidia bacterium]